MSELRTIEFTVPSVPVAQPRQQQRLVTPKHGGQPFVMNYLPTKHPVNAFKAAIQQVAREAYDGPPIQAPIELRLLFLMPRPGRLIWKTKAMPRVPHTSKPDLDNLQKSVKDALTKLTWADDSQVCRVHAEKFYASGTEQPSVTVGIIELAGDRIIEPEAGGIDEPILDDLFENSKSPLHLPAKPQDDVFG